VVERDWDVVLQQVGETDREGQRGRNIWDMGRKGSMGYVVYIERGIDICI
jgi:hypothetical protein